MLEHSPVEKYVRIQRSAVEPRSWSSLRILALIGGFLRQHPLLVPTLSHASGEVRSGQADDSGQLQEDLHGEPPSSFGRLRREEGDAEFVKATDLRGESQSVVGSHRFRPEKAAHSIFDGQRASFQSSRDHRPIELFELSAVGALGILKENDLVMRIRVTDKNAALGGMP